MINWSKLNKNKNKLMNVNNFWNLEVINKSSEDITIDTINLNKYRSVLEIGANDRHFKNKLDKKIKYKSMDIDKETYQDYYNIEDIEEKFDVICMFACVEDITKEIFINNYLPKIKNSLNKNGMLFISTNNIFHNIGIRTDLTHVQAYSPRDLNSIIMSNGFESGRCLRITSLGKLFRLFYGSLSKYLLRPYCIDYCPEILLINKKTDLI